jgi:hypothetical protein
MSFTNWVVKVRSKISKKHVKSMGKATEEEAKKLASEWNQELIRDGKDRWYEVVIQPPDVSKTKEELQERIRQVKEDIKEMKE